MSSKRERKGDVNKWVKRKWLRALKSGEYGKGAGRLASNPDTADGKYCCLGVLAAEMVPEFCHVNTFGTMTLGDAGYKEIYLPDDLATLWGLDRLTQEVLAQLNDHSTDFGPVIAYIEHNL